MLAVRHFSPGTFSADTGGKKRIFKRVRRGGEGGEAEEDKGFNSVRIEVSAERQKVMARYRGKE